MLLIQVAVGNLMISAKNPENLFTLIFTMQQAYFYPLGIPKICLIIKVLLKQHFKSILKED